jgi:hypothetical protein
LPVKRYLHRKSRGWRCGRERMIDGELTAEVTHDVYGSQPACLLLCMQTGGSWIFGGGLYLTSQMPM